MILNNGIDDANDEYLKQRIKLLKNDAYWHGICCLAQLEDLNNNITSNSHCTNIWKWELGMNLHLLLGSSENNEKIARDEIGKRVKLYSRNNKSFTIDSCLIYWVLTENY